MYIDISSQAIFSKVQENSMWNSTNGARTETSINKNLNSIHTSYYIQKLSQNQSQVLNEKLKNSYMST